MTRARWGEAACGTPPRRATEPAQKRQNRKMQQKVFTVPMLGGEEANEELNRYLRGQHVVAIDKEFCIVGNAGYWTFCVTVADGPARPAAAQGERREKVDYREVLDERSFAVFARLRNIRKQMAAEAAVPAYAIFTDAELADIAQLETLDEASLGQLQGIGTKRVEKYGREMLQRYYTEGQMT
ncbi:MAG: HRDC domain-containing protein [Bacteroidales bacterium]|nr:HRDC domain-containing protein [Bacteroidales bacterium]